MAKPKQWEKGGISPNPNGRPKNAKGRMSDKKLADTLAKGDEKALETLMELMDDKNTNVRLKSVLAWLGFDKSMRDFLYKKAQDQNKLKGYKLTTGEEDTKAPVHQMPTVSKKALT